MNLEKHIVGDTLDDTVTVSDYPASDGWTLKYRFTPRDSGGTAFDLTATTNADGERYDVQAAPVTTAAWVAGAYTWARWVEKAGARQTLDVRGQLELIPDPATTAAGYDSRTHARIALDAIEAVLENRATLDQENYTIANRSLSRTPIPDLMKLRSVYRNEVRSEEAADLLDSGVALSNKLQVRI